MARMAANGNGGSKRPAEALTSANDNGGPNVRGIGVRPASADMPAMTHYVMRRSQERTRNDRYPMPANDSVHVELYDEYLPEEHRYIEVSGRRETVETLLLIHNPKTDFTTRTVYMLNDEGNIIHQFELPEEIIRNDLKLYNAVRNPALRMNVTGKASLAIRTAAAQADIMIPTPFADSMFRCCAQQLVPPQPQQAMAR